MKDEKTYTSPTQKVLIATVIVLSILVLSLAGAGGYFYYLFNQLNQNTVQLQKRLIVTNDLAVVTSEKLSLDEPAIYDTIFPCSTVVKAHCFITDSLVVKTIAPHPCIVDAIGIGPLVGLCTLDLRK